MASPTQLLSYLRIMSSISGKATPVEKKKGFHDVLLSRIENLKDVLSKNSQLLELQARLENQWKRADIPDQLRWTFVNTCLELMRELKQSLMAMKAKEKCDVAKENRVTEAAPLPADALSVGDQNTVLTTIQFIVTLGMCPNLLPGVGVPLQKRSEFAHVLSSCKSIMSEKRLYDCLATLLDCIEHPQLGAIILSRHLPDILSGLLQISYAPLSSYSEHNKLNQTNCKESKNETKNNSEPNSIGQLSDQCWEVLSPGDMHNFAHNQVSCWQDRNQGVFITQPEREKCLFDLQRLLDRIYQPMVIRELLILQAGLGNVPQKRSGTAHSGKEHKLLPCTPKWLRDVCGLLLSERLMKPYGVKAVLLGVLEGSEDVSCSQDWKKCDTIAKLIANCPSQAQSVEEYYKHISPQILGLLRGPTAGLGRLLIRAASSVIREMFTQYPELTQKYVMSLITGPLEKTTEEEGECAGTRIDESTVMQCVEDIHRVFVLGSHQTGLTIVWPVVHPIFELFCFCRKSVFHLRSYVRDILVDIIRRTDPQDAFKLLYSLAFKQMPSHTFGANTSTTNTTLNHSSKQLHGVTEMFPMKFMSDSFVISHGDDGGLTIKYHSNGGDKLDDSNSIMGNLKGDLLSNSEARALCMVELLNDVKKDNAAGDFFIYLMQELTCIVLDCSEDTNSDLFEYGEAVSSQHRLLVLNHVALMCEKLGPSILSSTSQVLAFIKSTFQRGCTIVNAHDQELGVAFITETLSLALGMLSAILGGAVKIEQDQQPLLQELLPLLGTLATAHPALEIQQMARDLRIVIATRGAVWSHKIKKRAENKRNMKDFQGDGEKDATNDDEGTRLAGCDFDEAFVQLCDPLVPVRGHAIMRVASLLRQRHPKAMESADTLLKIFLDQLTHDDSYIYLAAIQGLVSLADIRADTVVPQLAREFAQCRNQAGQISAEDTVAKLRGHYLPDDTTSSQRAERSPELRMKLGEALVKATRTCGDLLPQYKQQLLPALLSGVKDSEPLVRASSLSNLGDVCQLLRFSLGPVLNEIFSSVTAVLKTDESAEVRRAAVLVITLLLRGLGKSAFEVVDTYLKQMYQLLKFVESTDPDVLTRAHAQAALGELDTITREYLFPKPSFTKHIQVLP